MGVLLFLDVSGGELLVVLLFVLLFFGSKGVPDVARTMGRALRQFRDATADVQREIEKGASDVKRGSRSSERPFALSHQSMPRPRSRPMPMWSPLHRQRPRSRSTSPSRQSSLRKVDHWGSRASRPASSRPA
ncbi:MAG: twin-arginine translocase TatA/TatE family subunit [Flavobacteriales bacterium]|nr:twin-arginine translocase TatA/TatE family subunit [Flavobacteriales bacterium]